MGRFPAAAAAMAAAFLSPSLAFSSHFDPGLARRCSLMEHRSHPWSTTTLSARGTATLPAPTHIPDLLGFPGS
ncbi:hypothetical protein BTVI_76955 [Pitangus sulphuratus]|nr:hypothetical protein BTVI_76955 [Pitangus sulphuratus]